MSDKMREINAYYADMMKKAHDDMFRSDVDGKGTVAFFIGLLVGMAVFGIVLAVVTLAPAMAGALK